MCHKAPSTWPARLKYALYAYHIQHHRAIGMSPHEALYGYQPKQLHLDIDDVMLPKVSVENRIRLLQEAHNFAATKSNAVRDTRNEAMPKTKAFSFAPGDYVKVSTYVRNKLSPHWRGPYKVIARTSDTTYKIEVEPGSRMHTNINISHLRPWYHDTEETPASLEPEILAQPKPSLSKPSPRSKSLPPAKKHVTFDLEAPKSDQTSASEPARARSSSPPVSRSRIKEYPKLSCTQKNPLFSSDEPIDPPSRTSRPVTRAFRAEHNLPLHPPTP